MNDNSVITEQWQTLIADEPGSYFELKMNDDAKLDLGLDGYGDKQFIATRSHSEEYEPW